MQDRRVKAKCEASHPHEGERGDTDEKVLPRQANISSLPLVLGNAEARPFGRDQKEVDCDGFIGELIPST